jgi:arsenate reductase (thioredoxin)
MRLVVTALAFLSFVVVLTTASAQSTSPNQRTRVVFVCEHGSVKSLVAMEYFNRTAQARGLSYRALARGVDPDAKVPDVVLTGLRADGFDVTGFSPRRITASDMKDAALVVPVDEDLKGLVGGGTLQLSWDNLPGVLADYAGGRNATVSRLDGLVEQLENRHQP